MKTQKNNWQRSRTYRAWNGTTFGSLSTIARAITGTTWNGPRFFGLRAAAADRELAEPDGLAPYAKTGPRASRSRRRKHVESNA